MFLFRIIKRIITWFIQILYLFSLYFKRGIGKTIFYVFTLVFILVLVGFLLETNSKMTKISEKINENLPSNRLKLGIVQKTQRNTKPAILSLFGNKEQEPIVRRKNFITPAMIQNLLKINGIKNVVGLTNIDFPMGVEFVLPGSPTVFRAEMIGVGIPSEEARRFVMLPQYKKFQPTDNKIPVLVASYILQVFNMILENNDIPFKITEKNVLGMQFNILAGSSFVSSKRNNQVEVYSCIIVGFIDIDYTYGIAFPQSFIEKEKKKYWQNYKSGFYDFLMVTLSINDFDRIEKEVKEAGFIIKEDTAFFRKISDFVNQNQEFLSLFLYFISAVILVMGIAIVFYTVSWMLKEKALEFSLYRFFGSSNLKILVLYGSYLSFLQVVAITLAYFIIKKIFGYFGTWIMSLQEKIPVGFQSILQPDFILSLLIINDFFTFAFIFLEIVSLSFIFFYLLTLNKKL